MQLINFAPLLYHIDVYFLGVGDGSGLVSVTGSPPVMMLVPLMVTVGVT